MQEQQKVKLVVILGPTASGKTKLAVDLARQFDGEIVSADSRQVYCGMDVGTGKDLIEYGDVKYHLINVADPKDIFTLADFKKQADAAIKDIAERGKLPMLVGGSGLYLQAVVDNYELAENSGANKIERDRLELLSVDELYKELAKKNPDFANRINNSDRNNKRRLIRYLELGVETNKQVVGKSEIKFDSLILGLMPDKELIEVKIKKRLMERLEKEDMIGEVERLRNEGVSDQRLKDFGLEYRFITEYLEEKFSYEEMVERLFIAIRQFAKRQITWFRRWERQGRAIEWIESVETAKQKINDFIK